jgi:hypothetical protein
VHLQLFPNSEFIGVFLVVFEGLRIVIRGLVAYMPFCLFFLLSTIVDPRVGVSMFQTTLSHIMITVSFKNRLCQDSRLKEKNPKGKNLKIKTKK